MRSVKCLLGCHDWSLLAKTAVDVTWSWFGRGVGSTAQLQVVECTRCGKCEAYIVSASGRVRYIALWKAEEVLRKPISQLRSKR